MTLSLRKRADIAHARLYAHDALIWSEAISTPRLLSAMTWFETEINNITLAFQRANDPTDLDQPALVCNFTLALFPYFDRVSMWGKWETGFGRMAIAAVERLDDTSAIISFAPRLYNAMGITRRMQGQSRLAEAQVLFERACDATDEDAIRSDAWVNLADLLRLQGKTKDAIYAAQTAIVYGEGVTDLNRQAKGWEYLGLAWLPENVDEAIQCYETALTFRKQAQNTPRVAQTLTMLAYGLTQRGGHADLQRACAAYEQSAEIDKQIHNWQAIARYWGDIAATYNKLGLHRHAIENSMSALDRNVLIQYKRGEILNYIRLAESHWMLGEVEQAVRCARRACVAFDALSAFDKKLTFPRFRQVLIEMNSHFPPNEFQDILQAISLEIDIVSAHTISQ